MKIKRVLIENFRSLERVEFAVGDFNVFVGRNNNGKTNLLEALEWFYAPSGNLQEIKYAKAPEGAEVVVEVEFDGAQDGIASISNEDNQKKLRNLIGGRDALRVRRTSTDPRNRYIFVEDAGRWQKQPTGVDSAFNNCIPRFEFILTDKSLKEVSAFKANTPIGQMLGGILSEALDKDPKYMEFKRGFEELFESPDSNVRRILRETSERVRTHLAMQFPDCAALDFEIEIPPFEDFLKNYTTSVDDGIRTDADAKGDGMQRALMLAIIKAHADSRRDDALGRSFIFFIDEAELHLHPTAQRQLKSALTDLSDSVDQIFLTTHSSVFLADTYKNQVDFTVEKDVGITTVTPMSPRERTRAVYELLGGSPADLLFPANFLIVEGASELHFLERVCSRFYSDKPRIQLVAANGDDERQAQYLSSIMKVYSPLGESPIYRGRVVIVFDRPEGPEKEARLNAFLEENRELRRAGLTFALPVAGLEDYYPLSLRERFANLTRKTTLAKRIGEEISRAEFEEGMPIFFEALKACWESAYGA